MSSNTNIGNTPVNQGYVQLIHTGETGGIDGTLRTLYDGDGTASDLQIASNKVKVSTELYIGSKTATEFIQDIVGDMFTTGSYTNITTTYDDTNGNIDLSASGEVTLTGTQTLTNKTLASPTFTGTANGANLTLTGDLTVSGDTIFTNSNTVLIGDAILTLNADETGSPTANAGFEVERGTSINKSFLWNETTDKWTIGSETFVAGTVEANLTGNVTGSASLNLLISNNLSDLANAATARTNLGVDAAGTDNSTDVTLAGSLDYITISGQQITRNAINLTTDVTGTLPVGNGGTGLTSISTLLNSNVTPTSLGLVIGTDVQAQDTLLQDIADFSLSNPSQDGYLIAYSDAEPQLELVAPGISFNGSTANGLLTYGNSTTADVESGLTYNGSELDVSGNVDATGVYKLDGTTIINTDGNFEVHDTRSATPSTDLGVKGVRFDFKNNSADGLSDGGSYHGVMTFQQWNDTSGGHIHALGFTDNGYVHHRNASISGTFGNWKRLIQENESGDVVLDATSKLYFDGGTHTYIHESAGDVVDFVVGGQQMLRLYEGGTDYVHVDDNTRLGVGNDPDFTIHHDASNTWLQNTTGNILMRNQSHGSKIQFGTEDSSGTLAYVLNITGDNHRVGIGTTTPQSKLNINVSAESAIPSAGNDTTFLMIGNDGSGTTNYGTMIGTLNTGNGYIQQQRFDGTATTYNLLLQPNGGNVGIGTSSPSEKLEVSGGSSDTFIEIHNSGGYESGIKMLGGSLDVWKIYLDDADNKLRIDEDGTAYMTIDGSGNVGIGETNPSFGLQIDGSNFGGDSLKITRGTSEFYVLNANNSYGVLGMSSNHDLQIRTNATTRMTIDNSGSVGIGTTSPAFSYASKGLEIQTTDEQASLRLERTGSTPSVFEISARNSDILLYNTGTARPMRFGIAGTERFRISANEVVVNEVGESKDFRVEGDTDTNLFFVDGSADRVGIGTGSPGGKLDVRGTASANNLILGASMHTVGGGHLSNYQTLLFKNTYNETGYAAIRHLANSHNDSASQLRFLTSNTSGTMSNQMTIDDTGFVGIGTTTPGYKLDVAGDARSDRLIFRTNASAPTADAAIFRPADNSVGISTNNTERVRVNSSGALHVTNDVVAFSTTPSDRKLKTNVKDIDYGLDTIMKLKPKQYDWKKDNRHDIGFIAQEVEEVIPEIVKDNEWFDDKIKTMDYEKLTAVLIKAVQEQQEQINKLKEQLNG